MILREVLTPEVINEYKVTIQVDENWVMLRHPQYSPTQASRREGRFNRSNECAFYVASGIDTTQAEVPDFQECNQYSITPGSYTAFDLQTFAEDHNCTAEFVIPVDSGDYRICQEVAQLVTDTDPAISGVIFASSQASRAGRRGTCMALLPRDRHLPDGFFVQNGGC
jgi:hypothetical protein